jgi:hypothetical protein
MIREEPMSDWKFEIPEERPNRQPSLETLEARLEACSERLLQVQNMMRLAERELSSLVKEAVTAGMPTAKVAALSRVTTDDIDRTVEKGSLY